MSDTKIMYLVMTSFAWDGFSISASMHEFKALTEIDGFKDMGLGDGFVRFFYDREKAEKAAEATGATVIELSKSMISGHRPLRSEG